jgi:hypothetical protein
VLSRLRVHVSLSNALSVLALFVALGGTAYATGVLPPNSVGTAQLKAGAVTGAKMKDGTLKAVDFGKRQLKPGPRGAMGATGARGPAGPGGVVDESLFYTKADAKARFLGGALVTVVAESGVADGTVVGVSATCPAGYQVIAGGVDPFNVDKMHVNSSEPLIQGQNVIDVPDGLQGAPTAWRAYVENFTGATAAFKVAAICAPLC